MSIKSMVNMLKECYAVSSLPENEAAKYWLIVRYEHKVSHRLLREKEALYAKGDKLCTELMRKLTYDKNPFLELVKKGERDFAGRYHPVPLVYEDQDE